MAPLLQKLLHVVPCFSVGGDNQGRRLKAVILGERSSFRNSSVTGRGRWRSRANGTPSRSRETDARCRSLSGVSG